MNTTTLGVDIAKTVFQVHCLLSQLRELAESVRDWEREIVAWHA